MTVRTFLYTVLTPWLPVLREEGVVVQWAWTSVLLLLAVLLVRALLKGKISLRARYALWAVAALRLLIPVQLPISLPAAPVELVEEIPYELTYPTVPMYPSATLPDAISSEMHRDPEDHTQATFIQTMPDGERVSVTVPIWSRYQHMLLVWWGGVLVVAGVVAASNLHFYGKLKKRRTPLEVEDSLLPVYVAVGLPSPCLFGLFKPAVYLTPEAATDVRICAHVLTHELTHYAHKDHLWAWVRCLCLALHWYNPLVWLAAILSKRDGELACDEGSIARLGEEERIPYGRTLVGLVAHRSLGPDGLFSCSTAMAEGKKTIQQRIELLVKRPQTVKAALFAAVSILVLCLVFVFARGADDRSEYEKFLDHVESVQSIGVGQPIYSDVIYLDLITDSELLARAQETLAEAEEIEDPEALGEDFSKANIHVRTLTLYSRPNGSRTTYWLYSSGSACYIALAGESWDAPFVPFATLPQETATALEYLARRQHGWDEKQITSEILISALGEDVSSIFFYCGPKTGATYHIMDEDLVEQAKEVLLSGDPQTGTVETGGEFDGATVTVRGTNGGGLTGFPITNREMCAALYEITQEQVRREEGDALDIDDGTGEEMPPEPDLTDTAENQMGGGDTTPGSSTDDSPGGQTNDEGTPAPEPVQWSVSRSFEPDLDASMTWNASLRATVTGLEDGSAEMSVTGDTGEILGLSAYNSAINLEPYFGIGGLLGTYDWGQAMKGLASAGALINNGERPDGSAAERAEVSKWMRVTLNGQDVPGVLSWQHGNGSAHFNFVFDEQISLSPGDQMVIELGA